MYAFNWFCINQFTVIFIRPGILILYAFVFFDDFISPRGITPLNKSKGKDDAEIVLSSDSSSDFDKKAK